MTYWRHTEFKTGVAPLLLDNSTLDECAAFMKAIGRGLGLDMIWSRVKGGYQNWRQHISEKLKILKKFSNPSRRMTITPTKIWLDPAAPFKANNCTLRALGNQFVEQEV